jgi:ATP-dependent DNA helicase RecQ
MSCVHRTGQRFGAAHVIEVLRGGDTEKIRQYDHHKLSTHGIGGDLDAKQWRGVFRQLVAAGLLEIDAEGYGAIRLTEASRAVLRGEQKVQLRRDIERTREKTARSTRTPTVAADLPPHAMPRFDALRNLRARLAREQNVPAYVIFHDATLRAIAVDAPSDLPSLGRISGVGASKLERYGAQVLEALQAG